MFTWLSRPPQQSTLSDSEQLLFSGALRHDKAWAQYENPLLRVSFWSMAKQFPAMMASVARAAWREDPRALLVLLAAELGIGLMRAFTLVATNQVLIAIFSAGPTTDRLLDAAPALGTAAAVTAASSMLSAVSVAASGRLEPKIERACTSRYYRGLARVELATLVNKETQRALDAGRYGIRSIRSMLSSSIQVINTVIGLVAAAGVLLLLHPVLVLALLLIAAPKAWGAVAVVRRNYASRSVWLDHVRATDMVTYQLSRPDAGPEVKAHRAGELLTGAYEDMAATAALEKQRLAYAEAGTDLMASAMSGVAALVSYGALWALLWFGAIPLAAAGTAVVAVRTSSQNLASLVMSVNRLYEESMYLADLETAYELAERNAIPAGGLSLPQGPVEVRCEKVSFSYPGAEQLALDEVSLMVPAGKVVALVGENGSGKTTLAKLLAGLYLPTQGQVFVNGVDVREADRDAVFDRVALLCQDFPHWPMTARANIHIGRPELDLDQERIEQAAREADALSVVDSLPDRWESIIVSGFERSTQLSGGQWQRMGSARARYRRAPLLIVDEPTSALDPRAEIEAFQALRSMTDNGTTVLLITHRLAATATADLIYVLDRGRVVEHGSHAELMTLTDGHYRTLYEMQAAQYARTPSSPVLPRPTPHS
ncbi:ABC transporter ATP-binding protein [Streptomyces gilvosporeus]|uniref:ABC transporter n=1 Tax=Streptomyces gilvosporeus TaxID=553510 RepID=A0A1V0TKT5_9ACTN|nr:ABC transporter ATP-binding protein [Streptomyces gilvosporeus]ARF53555.1 ABC transporter [Streptomyces gilvosporeus]